MAINFAAEHMQGYNNPEIEIVNMELSDREEIVSGITYNDIKKILARGKFPIVVLWMLAPDGNKLRYMLPLSYISDAEIKFTSIITIGDLSPSCLCFGVVFTPTAPPKLISIEIKA